MNKTTSIITTCKWMELKQEKRKYLNDNNLLCVNKKWTRNKIKKIVN